MLRHMGFGDEEELVSFLRSSVPRDAYVSCACYESPKSEMEKKGWLGADLVFDIDADHISTTCNKAHDEWVCGNCGLKGTGVIPEKCPACGSGRFEGNTWPCPVCLASAKAETVRLLDMLATDFGFSQKEIHVFFSGHRGYHVHVESDAVKTLDSVARKEIVDYLQGLGLSDSSTDNKPSSHKAVGNGRILNSYGIGWRRRIALGIRDLLSTSDNRGLLGLGLDGSAARVLLLRKDAILENWEKTGGLRHIKGVGSETWKRLVELSVKAQSAEIDTVVTTDIHRLIRLPDTLHGRTGFKKTEFPVSDISGFDPFERAIAFKGGSATVFVSSVPEFRLEGETFGPFRNEKMELPTAAALLLVCKGRAEVLD